MRPRWGNDRGHHGRRRPTLWPFQATLRTWGNQLVALDRPTAINSNRVSYEGVVGLGATGGRRAASTFTLSTAVSLPSGLEYRAFGLDATGRVFGLHQVPTQDGNP